MECDFPVSKFPVSQNEIVNPLCIILVKNGSKGDRLLFRYPCTKQTENISSPKSIKHDSSLAESSPPVFTRTSYSTGNSIGLPKFLGSPINHVSYSNDHQRQRRPNYLFRRQLPSEDVIQPIQPTNRPLNPYALRKNEEENDIVGFSVEPLSKPPSAPRKSNVSMELSDKDLSNLLAVNTELSERKFELKVNEVRFVGHPTLMQHPSIYRPVNAALQSSSTKIFHIVFCLNAMASHSIVKCFYDLSKRLGIALRHEEYRCGYLSQEMKKIISQLDEACQERDEEDEDEGNYFQIGFEETLRTSSLARLLKKVHDDVCNTGFVRLSINRWVNLSFCLPHKIHVLPYRDPAHLVEPDKIHRCLEAIRPYHALLLLMDRDELGNNLALDTSSTIPRLLQVYSPMKSLQVIAADADLTLSQVVEIASHLVYWAMAIVIYPMCETNIYVVAPDAPITSADMEEAFGIAFPGLSLAQTLSDFSLPMPLGERANPALGGSFLQTHLVQLVCWLLQYRLLIQLHTYVYLQHYVEENAIENSLSNEQERFTMEVRAYEHDAEDDVTLSDSYSETTGDDTSLFIASSTELSSISAAAAAIVGTSIVSENDLSTVDTVDSGNPPSKKLGGVSSGATYKETLTELTETARRAIECLKIQLSIAEIKLFGRLAKYLTGEYHFEEIMYRENVRRSQLLLLLDKFREVLIIFEREDSTIDFFKVEQW